MPPHEQINTATDQIELGGRSTRTSTSNCSFCAVATLIGEGATSTSIWKELVPGRRSRKPEGSIGFARYHAEKQNEKIYGIDPNAVDYQQLGMLSYLETKGLAAEYENKQEESRALMAMAAYPSGTRFLVSLSGNNVNHIIYGEKYGNHLHFIDSQPTPAIHYLDRPKIWNAQGEFFHGDDIQFIAVRPEE